MSKFNFVRDGESKLPPGFRFEPTDEEIVFQYLARKTFSYPLPATVIPEINILSFDPWHLPGEMEQDRYFFSSKETNYRNNVNRSIISNLASCGGYWKATDSDKLISCSSKRMPIAGIRRTLVFYKGKHPRATRTDWFMNIYCIAALQGETPSNKIQLKKNYSQCCNLIQVGKWVLCHVFLKRSSNRVYDNDKLRNYCNSMITVEMSDTESASSSSSTSSSDSDSSLLSEDSSASSENEISTPNV